MYIYILLIHICRVNYITPFFLCHALSPRTAAPAAPPGVPPAAAACRGWADPGPRRRCGAPPAAGPGIRNGLPWGPLGRSGGEIPWEILEIDRNPMGKNSLEIC